MAETVPAIASAQAKLEQVMPLDQRQRMQALTEAVTLDSNDLSTQSPGKALLTMSRAAQLQRRVHLHYRSRGDRETERDLDPYGLAFRQGCWHVVGFCCLRRRLRSFRLGRIVQVDLTDTSFERPQSFDPLAHLARSWSTLPRQFT